jgi:hypothetical protein
MHLILKWILLNRKNMNMENPVKIIFAILVFAMAGKICLAQSMVVNEKSHVKVIFETDMCLDVDDVGALATLHALTDQGETELLAVCFNEVHKDGAKAIDAINTWYNRGEIPVGIYKKFLHAPDPSPYLSRIAELPNDIPDNLNDVPSALDVYIQTLKSQPDNSVTIVSAGFLNNLADLLEVEPKLIAEKVKELVIMGGVNNDGFNLVRHDLVNVSEKIFNDWPTPIVISQPGGDIMTGVTLKETPVENPVREAYYYWFDKSFKGRSSWDQIAVLYGVRGLKYFSLVEEGTGRFRNGYTIKMKTGWRSYITKNMTNEEYSKILDELMTKSPIMGN